MRHWTSIDGLTPTLILRSHQLQVSISQGRVSLPAPSRVKNRDPNRGEPVTFFSFSLTSLTRSCLPARTTSPCLAGDFVFARSGVAGAASSSSTGDFRVLPSNLLGTGTGILEGEVICAGRVISAAFLVARCSWDAFEFGVSGTGLEVGATLSMFREGPNADRSR